MKIVRRFLLAGMFLAVLSLTNLNAATTFSNIEQMSGWNWCSACAKAGGGAVLSMLRGQGSPSLDGASTKFFLGGATPWSHALYYKRLSSNSTATNFIYDVYYYMKAPSASSGMEFSVSQRVGYKWYRVDTQCSFLNGNWRLWNNSSGHWYDTSVPCRRPAAYTWRHLIIEGKRANGKVVFVSITDAGKKYYLNKSFYPLSMSSSSSSVTMHFQLNGDRNQTDYSVWGDKFKVTYW
jgi:hypothetical protein